MMQHRLRLVLFISSIILAFSAVVQAKELSSRLGIGYITNTTLALPSVAAIYHPSTAWGVLGAVGIDSSSNNSAFAATGGVRKIIFTEDNMNFFMGGNLSLVSQTIPSSTSSGFEVAALVGGEFFLSGLENLGFNFDTGIAVSNMNYVRFRTLGDSFLNGGVIFYF